MHNDRVRLPDGNSIRARSHPGVNGYGDDQPPTFGLYLDPLWSPPWAHAHIDWPDFGLPTDIDAFDRILRDVHARVAAGEDVETGCLGGHGRTGTFLGCLAVLAGLANDPVDWVRTYYCAKAIETQEQEDFTRRRITS